MWQASFWDGATPDREMLTDNKVTKKYVANLDALVATGNDILHSVSQRVQHRYSQQ